MVYETLSEAIADLTKKGYTHNFNINNSCIECHEKNVQLKPNEFHIDELFRFEGDTDPGDENVLYAISAAHLPMKGLLVNAYGMYSDAVNDDLIKKLKVH